MFLLSLLVIMVKSLPIVMDVSAIFVEIMIFRFPEGAGRNICFCSTVDIIECNGIKI